MMSDSNTSQLIETLLSRLNILRLQEVRFGTVYAPAHLLLEIQELEKQLAELIPQRTQQMFDARHLQANPPPLARGIITAVSVRNSAQELKDQAAFQAIDYHRAMLRHCWLIATSEKNSQCSEPTAHELKRHFEHYQVPCSIYLLDNGADPLEMRQLMSTIYGEIEQAGEYTADELICDITSGTKAMTIGMALACGSKYRMQYMLSYQQGLPSLPMVFKIDE
jgi:hypothetical protein